MKMMTAYTTEVDEVEDALQEILGQIDLGSLQKNTVGLITCHFDFPETHFIEALCKKLPFPVIGMTTMSSGNTHGHSMYALSLSILTSDEVSFQVAFSDALGEDNYREKMKAAYDKAASQLPGPPSMVIGLFPYLHNISGAQMVKNFDEISGSVPLWGSLATDPEVGYDHCYVFCGEKVCKESLAMILFHGPVNPEFIIVSVPAHSIRKSRGRITDSHECIVKKINGLPAMQYFESIGAELKGVSNITPLVVYYEGSSVPVALAIYSSGDDGSLLCGGETPVGASISIGEITPEGILASADEGITRILESGKTNGALFLPCVTRYVMLTPDHNSELVLAEERMGKSQIPYMVGYSGGEICPVRDESGNLRNCFHNYTFSACAF